MLKCKDIAHQASHYIDPSLPWYRKTAWYLHLAMCNNCRRFVKQFKLTVAFMQRWPRTQASKEQVAAVMSKLHSPDN